MDGLDVKLEQVHNHVRDQNECMLTFKAVFAHSDAQRIMYDTNFVAQITPRIKDTLDSMFEDYLTRVGSVRTGVEEEVTTAQRQQQLGSSRRVVHVEHFAGHTCSVCQSSFVLNEFMRTLPVCKHIFHKRCIDPWIKRNQNPTCPVCREHVFIHTSSGHSENPVRVRPSAGRSRSGPGVHVAESMLVPSSSEEGPPDSV